jgi:hypothetical protein
MDKLIIAHLEIDQTIQQSLYTPKSITASRDGWGSKMGKNVFYMRYICSNFVSPHPNAKTTSTLNNGAAQAAPYA